MSSRSIRATFTLRDGDGHRVQHEGPFYDEEQRVPATYPVVADVLNDGTAQVVFRLIDRPAPVTFAP